MKNIIKSFKIRFYNNKNSSGDSYYRENTYHHKDLKPKEVLTNTFKIEFLNDATIGFDK